MTSLTGKNAVITGSTSGIGLGIAHALAAEVANIVLNGLAPADASASLVAEFIQKYGIKVLYSSADMSKPGDIQTLIQYSEKQLGSVDILINNAGIQFVEKVEDFPIEKWDAIIAINMSSNFHSVRAAVPGMKSRGWGRIINISSAHALIASPFKSAYVTAKHGVAGFTKTIALELATFGITANTICPGYVLTPLVEDQIADQARTRGITPEEVKKNVLLAAQPTKEFTTVEQIGALCVFLSGPNGANMTGGALTMDGGWTAQ